MLTEVISAVLAAVASAVVTYYLSRPGDRHDVAPLPGTPLAAKESYPVLVDSAGRLILDLPRMERAAVEILNSKNARAAADLIYLADRNSNLVAHSPRRTRRILRKVKRRYRRQLRRLGDTESQRTDMLSQFMAITAGVGDTLGGVPIEFVLHDTRDPLHSVQAIRNPITGRVVGSPNSNFGVELIKTYAIHHWAGTQHSYQLTLPDGREIKATTIPLEHPVLGLVAFLCINLDIARFSLHSRDLPTLLARLTATSGHGTEILRPGN